ncbi:hypothetical protein BG015_002127 [Linnemannia schmuckeri]|uniref:F-box domain-containing protein n=1 Tax=Linnemannia schmuckeri TaxID=64567 RepID=A0A9P5RRN9_9FUNG|nr:hypothetical protein BG015_002127 [Linnemannia schmuckeri]
MFWACKSAKKRKETDKLTRTNAFAPCNRVLAIPELRDLLYSFFSSGLTTSTTGTLINNSNTNKNSKRASCMLVCRHWNSFFAPYHWSHISLTNQNHYDFSQVIQAQGYRVRKFSCSKVDKSILTSLVQHCQSLEELNLGFGEKAFWMQYDFLEQIFIDLARTQQWHLQDWEKVYGRRGLRKVEITLNMLDFRPRMLWSLCQLPYLRNLTINANGSIGEEESSQYLEDVTLYLLECCPSLESFTVHYNALTMHRHPFEYRNWLKEKVETETARGPMTPQDAISRCRHTSPPVTAPRWSEWPSEKHGDHFEQPSLAQHSTQEKTKTWNLRRLALYGFRPDTSVLPRIFSRCPRLKEIGIHLGWSITEAETWISLATHCPDLKVLNISGFSYQYREYDILSIPELLAMFPRLETFNAKDYPRQDLDLQSLDSSLVTYAENGVEQGHSLKSFSLVGHGSGSLCKVLDVLASRSFTQLKELKIEYTFSSPWQQAKAVTPNISTEGSLLDFSRSWDVVARTLVKLDMHGLQFPDKATTVKFFQRLQGFGSLRVVRASCHHLKDLISTAATTDSPTSLAPSDTPNPGDILLLPTVDYRFPHIQDLLIPAKWVGSLPGQDVASDLHCPTNSMLTLNDILFLVAATPSLKTLSLARNLIASETAAFVRRVFRQVCLDTNHEESLL